MLTLRLNGGSHVTSWPWSSIRPRRRLLEAADHPEGRRLAAAGRAEEAEELAVADLEVDVVDGDLVAELLDDIDEPDVDLRQLALSRGTGSPRAGRCTAGWATGGCRPTDLLRPPIGRPRIGVAAIGVSRTRGADPHGRGSNSRLRIGDRRCTLRIHGLARDDARTVGDRVAQASRRRSGWSRPPRVRSRPERRRRAAGPARAARSRPTPRARGVGCGYRRSGRQKAAERDPSRDPEVPHRCRRSPKPRSSTRSARSRSPSSAATS